MIDSEYIQSNKTTSKVVIYYPKSPMLGCPVNPVSYDSHYCSMAIWFREARHLAPRFIPVEDMDN
jgi:hypothetical protein